MNDQDKKYIYPVPLPMSNREYYFKIIPIDSILKDIKDDKLVFSIDRETRKKRMKHVEEYHINHTYEEIRASQMYRDIHECNELGYISPQHIQKIVEWLYLPTNGDGVSGK